MPRELPLAVWESHRLLAQNSQRWCMWGAGGSGRTDRKHPGPQPPDHLPWSTGLFPEADIPEEAYQNPRGGRRVRMKKRLSGSQLQDKTGRPSSVGFITWVLFPTAPLLMSPVTVACLPLDVTPCLLPQPATSLPTPLPTALVSWRCGTLAQRPSLSSLFSFPAAWSGASS